jgi:hypothetical protein
LEPEPARWEGPLGVRPTYAEITDALRGQVLSLIEKYIDRVLLILIGELETLPLLAREFNAELGKIADLIASQCSGLIEEADSILLTGFSLAPPPVSIQQILEEKLRASRRRDYFRTKPSQPCEVSPVKPQPANAADFVAEGQSDFGARADFVRPILVAKGWSILDWASESNVDFHTANNYLNGRTKPYASTRRKLADSLGVNVGTLPN